METLSLVLFACLAAAALLSGLFVVAHRSPVTSVFSLVVNALCVAGIFLLLGDPFLAAIQVIVYAGAIIVLFLFVVMLLDVRRDELRGAGGRLRRLAVVALLACLGAALGAAAVAGAAMRPAATAGVEPAGLAPFSDLLFGRYLLPFEVVSLLLLAAMLGVTVLTMRRPARRPAAGGGDAR